MNQVIYTQNEINNRPLYPRELAVLFLLYCCDDGLSHSSLTKLIVDFKGEIADKLFRASLITRGLVTDKWLIIPSGKFIVEKIVKSMSPGRWRNVYAVCTPEAWKILGKLEKYLIKN